MVCKEVSTIKLLWRKLTTSNDENICFLLDLRVILKKLIGCYYVLNLFKSEMLLFTNQIEL